MLIGGNIDLSVGSTLSLCGLISCSLTGMGTPIAIVVPLIVGLLCGALNGFMVGRLRFNPFITTLGTMAVFQALAYYTTDGKFINAAANNSFMQIGQGFLLVVPIPVLILLGVFALLSYVLTQTVFGRQIFAVGGNAECARFSGISYSKTTIFAYALSGLAAAASGIILVSRQMAGQPEMGSGYEFDVITALVLGGVALSGGKGTIWGAILGVLFIGILKNAFILLGIALYYQYIVMGAILVFAVGMDVFSERRMGSA